MAVGVGTRAHTVDIDKMVFSITNKLNTFWSLLENVENEISPCQIYRVPQHIREVDDDAYDPIVLSIGPYHHGAPQLQTMERVKWEYLGYILKLNCEISLHDYLNAIAKLEKLTRTCYSDIAMERKSFLRMLLLDGCFILINIDENINRESYENVVSLGMATREVGRSTAREGTSARAESETTTKREHAHDMPPQEVEMSEVKQNQARSVDDSGKLENDDQQSENHNKVGDWYSVLAWHDILLLENQVPFFIVEKIYQLAAGKRVNVASFADKAFKCIEDVLRHYPKAIQEPYRLKHIHHLLHLCHLYLKPSQKPCNDSQRETGSRFFRRLLHFGHKYFRIGQQEENTHNVLPMHQLDCFKAGELPVRWRSAVQYHEAGIRIKKRQYDHYYNTHSLLDIKFSNGVVEIPCFHMDENTESLFKNLIAFEQIDPQIGNDITAYVVFMSQIVSTPADASLFTKNGIILHMLDSDDEVPAIFTRLNKQVSFTSDGCHYLKSMCYLLEAHYQSRLNRWIAWLWLNHFSNPWLALAALAAVIVLFCTVVQTIYTVLAYVKPPS